MYKRMVDICIFIGNDGDNDDEMWTGNQITSLLSATPLYPLQSL
jgi:hypothetical protein